MSRVTRMPRNSINDRPGRLKLLLRRHRRLLRPIGWGCLAVALVALVASAFRPSASEGTVVTMRDRLGTATAALGLRVQDVVVEGRTNTSEAALRAAIGVGRGAPILGFSVADARARIEQLAWVSHATVERQWPGTVIVTLQERRPFAVWQNQGRFVVIDRNGQIVADKDIDRYGSLPLVVGPGAPGAAATLVDALIERPALHSHVIAAVRIGERRWNLRTDGGADVLLPEGAEVAALDRLLALQQDHALLDRPLAAVDMRLPDRLVLRPQIDGAKPPDPVAPHAPQPTTRKPT